MRLIRLIVNWVILLTSPLWVLFAIIFTFITEGMDKGTFIKGTKFFWK